MYDTQEIATRIKFCAKNQKIAIKKLLTDCNININAISEFSKGKQMSCINLARIADYLNCSVDYLLGRKVDSETSIPENLQELLAVASRLSCDQLKDLLQYAEFIESKNK